MVPAPAPARRAAPGRARRDRDRRGRPRVRGAAGGGAAGGHAERRPARRRPARAGRRRGRAGAVGLEVLRPVQPMLAATATSVAEAIDACGRSSVEWKLDGARIQVHRAGDEVRIFTRNLNDVTDRLPGIVAVVRALPATSFVLDGEAIGLGDDERPDLFQDTMSRFGRQDGSGGDVGRDVLRLPAPRRRRTSSTARCSSGSPRSTAWSARSGCRASSPTTLLPPRPSPAEAVAAGHEGVMVKGADLDLRGRPPRQRVAQGQARDHARPRGARRRVGPRPAAGLAVEPAPRRPGSRRGVRHGRQDVQGPHRRAADVADRRVPGARRRPPTATSCSSGPSSSSRSRSTACRRRLGTPAASRCGSPG